MSYCQLGPVQRMALCTFPMYRSMMLENITAPLRTEWDVTRGKPSSLSQVKRVHPDRVQYLSHKDMLHIQRGCRCKWMRDMSDLVKYTRSEHTDPLATTRCFLATLAWFPLLAVTFNALLHSKLKLVQLTEPHSRQGSFCLQWVEFSQTFVLWWHFLLLNLCAEIVYSYCGICLAAVIKCEHALMCFSPLSTGTLL